MQLLIEQIKNIKKMRLFKNLKCYVCDFFKLIKKINREFFNQPFRKFEKMHTNI